MCSDWHQLEWCLTSMVTLLWSSRCPALNPFKWDPLPSDIAWTGPGGQNKGANNKCFQGNVLISYYSALSAFLKEIETLIPNLVQLNYDIFLLEGVKIKMCQTRGKNRNESISIITTEFLLSGTVSMPSNK